VQEFPPPTLLAPPRTPAQLQGQRAEAQALAYLQAQGLILIARNVRYRCGELDLIMRDQHTLAFIEVRWRRPSRFVSAAASVDFRKQQRLIRAARCWLAANAGSRPPPCRFDVVACTPGHLDWIPNAFQS
jgi:putative endonuclease